MFVNSKNCEFSKSIFVKEKEKNKIIQSYSSIIIKNKVQIPKSFLLINNKDKKENSTYVLNKKRYNLKSVFNKSTCYVSGKDSKGILKYLKINADKEQSITKYIHKVSRNKLIIKDNIITVKYYIPYHNGDILKINEKDIKNEMKDFKIVAQKYSYIEYDMDFEENTIKNIEGLPQGMIFDKNCLKGTPMISGNFLISIQLNNGTIISGLIIVPQLPRQL
ncbi:hypothetical protein HBE96_06660 [Clostridium sp. P21]|uniref:Uncharacterized protein n=1 Tax=Clostridium muellerianum TaxID=2716538 RepID=A0A7Y0HP66_9CLOT|nr:hypothetical protein [Clostridium muellerianum]NMM62373.1 hypothetical protein [Clostridium muellerianum]